MDRQTLVSGLDRRWFEAALGRDGWSDLADRWVEPGAILAGEGDVVPPDLGLLWLYRSPAMAVLSAAEGSDPEQVLLAWADTGRAALNLRRGLKSRLAFACVDDLGEGQLQSLLGVAAKAPARKPEPAGRARPALDALLVSGLPWLRDVHSLIESASVAGSGPRPAPPAADPMLAIIGQFRALLDEERRGRAELARVQATADTLAQDREGALGVIAELQDSLEQTSVGRADALAQNARLEQEIRSLQEQGQLAAAEHKRSLARLASERAERLKCAAESAALTADRNRALQQLVATQEELERRVVEADQLPAMKMQLSYLQEELAARLAQASAPASARAPLIRRMKRRAKTLLGRKGGDSAALDREEAITALRASHWFDQTWYLAQNQDVVAAGIDPVVHYLDHGADEGRDPGPRFSTRFYVGEYADVAAAGMNPLLHFIRHGLGEGRLPRRG